MTIIKKKRTGLYIPCDNCGEQFYITKSRYAKDKTHCCSKRCAFELKTKNVREYRTCIHCGRQFETFKVSKQMFCSADCYNIWQKGRKIGEENPKFTSVKVLCDCCKKEIFVPPHKMELSKYHFCSRDCRKKWYAEVWSQRPEWRETSRKRAISILKNGMTRESKPQLFVDKILEDLKVSYEREFECGRFSIDDYLFECGLMIEVMGDYWHCNPIKFPESEITDRMKDRIERDKAKHSYVIQTYGVEILYIWEQDCNNYELVKALVDLYVASGGVLENYNSFNYHYDNNSISLNDEIIYPYFTSC